MYVPLSPNCSWSVEDKSNPVSATCVNVTSWSSPKFITAPSAKNKSENSNELVPNAAPSEASGTNAVVAVIVVPELYLILLDYLQNLMTSFLLPLQMHLLRMKV